MSIFEEIESSNYTRKKNKREFYVSLRLAGLDFNTAVASLIKQYNSDQPVRDSITAAMIRKDHKGAADIINKKIATEEEVEQVKQAFEYFDRLCTISGVSGDIPEFYKKLSVCKETETISTDELGAVLMLVRVYKENIITDEIFKDANSIEIKNYMHPYQNVAGLELKVVGYCKDRFSCTKSPVIYCVNDKNQVYRFQLLSSGTNLGVSVVTNIAKKIKKIKVNGRIKLHRQPGRKIVVGTINESATIEFIE